MSRPPLFRTAYTTTGNPLPNQRTLAYLGDEFADFLATQRSLATEEQGFPAVTAEGDFAGTLMELSALVAHVLGIYQNVNANEAFIGTAQSQRSLVLHGRRLAYEPDPGLSATGFAILTANPGPPGLVPAGPPGLIPAGFGLQSFPVGLTPAQDYETTADLEVDPAHNTMLPASQTQPLVLHGATTFQVSTAGLRIVAGEVVVLALATTPAQFFALEVTAVSEDATAQTTTLTVRQPLPAVASFQGATLLAKPATRLHLFGYDTSPNDFSDADLQGGQYPLSQQGLSTTSPPPAVGDTWYGYVATPSYGDDDIYLADELKKNLVGQPVARLDASGPTAFTISKESPVNVMFETLGHLQTTITFPSPPAPAPPGNTTTVDTYPAVQTSKSVTAIQVVDNGGNLQTRAAQSIRTSQWLFDWAVGVNPTVSLVTTQPNPTLVSLPLTLSRTVTGLGPGQLVALSTLAGRSPAITEIARISAVGSVIGASGAPQTTLSYTLVDPTTNGNAWTLGNLQLLGNVVSISHGKTISSEVLGDSDGITPFLRFALKQSPVTQLPGADGATPALGVMVGAVTWTLVDDFEGSSEHDTHYIVQRDETQTTYVVFGDGQKGMVPAAGSNNISATYRVGVGLAGNAAAQAVSRIKKSSPFVASAVNPRAVLGGSDPASLADVRTQATTYIKTFDRAVSIDDHKNLALSYPGVVKASALWTDLTGTGVRGVKVIVADAEGTPPAIDAITAFLQARRDDTVPLLVTGVTAVELTMRMELDVAAGYDVEIVKLAVRAALTDDTVPGLFTFAGRDLGQPAFLSEIYAVVLAVDGVQSIQVWQLDTLVSGGPPPTVRVVDTVAIQPDEWLELQPQNLDFAPAPEASP